VLALALGSAGLLGGGRALGAATTVTVLGGSVFVRHGANGSLVAAVDGEVLTAGDVVLTSDGARAVLTYFEGSTVTIEPNTQLSIDEAAASNGATRVSMTQDFGRTWHVVTRLIGGGSKYEVRTPAATASVRGTEFQVDRNGQTTTVTAIEGTVVDRVPDPAQGGQTVEVPIPAGQQHTQPANARPAPIDPAPDPERKVTLTVNASSLLVVDPLGRANGVTPDGRVVVQTPGARVHKDVDAIVIEHKGGEKFEVHDVVKVGGDKSATSGLELMRRVDGRSDARTLAEDEKRSLAKGKVGEIPTGQLTSERRAGQPSNENDQGGSGGSGSTGAGGPPIAPGANHKELGPAGEPSGDRPTQAEPSREPESETPKIEPPQVRPPQVVPSQVRPPQVEPPKGSPQPSNDQSKNSERPKGNDQPRGGDSKGGDQNGGSGRRRVRAARGPAEAAGAAAEARTPEARTPEIAAPDRSSAVARRRSWRPRLTRAAERCASVSTLKADSTSKDRRPATSSQRCDSRIASVRDIAHPAHVVLVAETA